MTSSETGMKFDMELFRRMVRMERENSRENSWSAEIPQQEDSIIVGAISDDVARCYTFGTTPTMPDNADDGEDGEVIAEAKAIRGAATSSWQDE